MPELTYICKNCYNNYQTRDKRTKGFCSYECSYEYRKKSFREEYDNNLKLCLKCGSKISFDSRRNDFCSQSCAASFRNTGVNRYNTAPKFCLNCGKKLSGASKIYCSNNCQTDHKRSQYIHRWKEGLETGVVSTYLTSSIIRNYILEKFNNKCAKCGWEEVNTYTNRIPLDLHHIDGNPVNNKEDNLIILCPNCHALEPVETTNKKILGRHRLGKKR